MQERSTGERHTGKNDERGMAPAPVPADVGIVAAMPMEVGDLIGGLKKVYKYQSVAVPVIEGEYAGKIIAVAVGGMGRPAAARRRRADCRPPPALADLGWIRRCSQSGVRA
jgi:hypothetical protein